MRRTTAFLSLALFVGTFAFAACSDRQAASPTAPAAGPAGIKPSQDLSTSQASASGKPTPAFTQIVEVTGNLVLVPAAGTGGSVANCPLGSTVVGGGYNFTGYNVFSPPWVKSSRKSQNGWAVDVINETLNSSAAAYTAYAYCAS